MTVHKVCIDCPVSAMCIGGRLPRTGIYRYAKLYTMYEIKMQTWEAGNMPVNVPIGCPRVTLKVNDHGVEEVFWGSRS